MTHASLKREWQIPISSAYIGVGKEPFRCAVRTRGTSRPGAALHCCSLCWSPSSMHKVFLIADPFQRCSRRHQERNSNAEQSCGLIHVGHKLQKHNLPHLRSSMRSLGRCQHSSSLWTQCVQTTSVMHEHDLRVFCRDVHGFERFLLALQLPTNQITSRCFLRLAEKPPPVVRQPVLYGQ